MSLDPVFRLTRFAVHGFHFTSLNIELESFVSAIHAMYLKEMERLEECCTWFVNRDLVQKMIEQLPEIAKYIAVMIIVRLKADRSHIAGTCDPDEFSDNTFTWVKSRLQSPFVEQADFVFKELLGAMKPITRDCPPIPVATVFSFHSRVPQDPEECSADYVNRVLTGIFQEVSLKNCEIKYRNFLERKREKRIGIVEYIPLATSGNLWILSRMQNRRVFVGFSENLTDDEIIKCAYFKPITDLGYIPMEPDFDTKNHAPAKATLKGYAAYYPIADVPVIFPEMIGAIKP